MRISIFHPLIIQELGSRSNQEDSVWPQMSEATEESRFFFLCDGMGGHEKGEVASQLVCKSLSEYMMEHWKEGFFSDSLFLNALDDAFRSMDEKADDSYKKMGTTMTFLCLHQGGAFMAHIGDSRIYHIRPSQHRILYKSRDHSLAYDLFMAGEISLEEMRNYPKKNVITRAMMPQMESRPLADVAHSTDIQRDDYFFLCSDGMLENMSDEELVEFLCSDMSDAEKREALINATKDNNDNHSAYLLHISNVEVEDGDTEFANDESTTLSNAIYFENLRGAGGGKKEKAQLKRMGFGSLLILVLFAVCFLAFLLWFLLGAH